MRRLISIPLLLLLSGCADLGYYWHSTRGHLAVMSQRVDIEELLQDPSQEASLQQRLELVQAIRRFSVERLALPDNGSYLSYVELDRPYVIQNLFAAPEFSTRLHRWCYPIVGCASYRGYYDETRLQAYIDELEAQGLETHVGKVSAYSTLGWFDDPVLSSFIHWPEYRLAGLIFHELTHQQIYIDDDTTFNESLASAVQQVGTRLWLEYRKRDDVVLAFERWLAYRDETIALIQSTRDELAAIYARDTDDEDKRAAKAGVFVVAREAHAAIARRHGIDGGFNRWFEEPLNNAKIGSVAAYHSQAAAFIRMIDAHGLDFAGFYRYVEKLGRLEKSDRDRCINAWSNDAPGRDACPVAETAAVF